MQTKFATAVISITLEQHADTLPLPPPSNSGQNRKKDAQWSKTRLKNVHREILKKKNHIDKKKVGSDYIFLIKF